MNFALRLASALTLFFLVSCMNLTPQENSARYYVLSAIAPESEPEFPGFDPQMRIGVDRVTLPGYLDTERIVTQNAQNEFILSDFDLWAEPLAGGIEQTVAKNISALTGLVAVETYPWRAGLKKAVKIRITVEDFYAEASGPILLDVQWRIDFPGKRKPFFGEHVYRVECFAGADYPEIAAAMSQAIEIFTRDIVQEITDNAIVVDKPHLDPSNVVAEALPSAANGLGN
jgi:uncharacterized protein